MPERIGMVHGAGGVESRDLIRSVFLDVLTRDSRKPEEDAALIADGKLAITTDGFAVDPPVFPGGDIGKLAVCGTVNDLAVRGARARWLAAAWMLPDGFPTDLLRDFARSMAQTASAAGIDIVAGDTKVLAATDLRGPVVTTTGVGVVQHLSSIADVRPGDRLIVTDGVGEHAAALLAAREGLIFDDLPPSDCRLLTDVTELAFGAGAHFARDATRGGLAAVLHEIAETGPYRLTVALDAIPVRAPVAAFCDILGVSPVELACEGCAVIAAGAGLADAVVGQLRTHAYAQLAAVVGEVHDASQPWVEVSEDGRLTWLTNAGQPIPRLC